MSYKITLCPDGQPPKFIELAHASGVRLTLMDWGGTWLSCRVVVGESEREILLGCAQLEDYFTQTAYLGATVGRYANRIGHAQFAREGKVFHLVPNQGEHQLHGGPDGFDSRRWSVLEQGPEHVVLGIKSEDGDQGFPGSLSATVCYRLQADARVSMEYTATVDAPCPVNLTNHAYFNLDGGVSDIRQHGLMINAQHYVPTDADLIPLGDLAPVAGTSFDFTQSKAISRDFLADTQQQLAKGYDHAYLLNPECLDLSKVAASAVSGDGRLTMDLFTTKPALQFYSGNHLSGVPARQGGCYLANQGLALETQFLPDSPNHLEWPQPDCWLRPGEVYRYTTVLAFRRT